MMKKLLIFVGATFAVGVAAMAGTLLYAERIVRAYQPEIQQALEKALNSTVSLGRVHLSIVPRPTLKLHDLVVSRAADTQFTVTIRLLEADLRVQPLLSRRFVISRVVLSDPHIDFSRNPQKPAVARESRPRASPDINNVSASSGELPFDLEIESAAIHNGIFVLQDYEKQSSFRANSIEAESSISVSNATVTMAASTIKAELSHGKDTNSARRVTVETRGCEIKLDNSIALCEHYAVGVLSGQIAGKIQVAKDNEGMARLTGSAILSGLSHTAPSGDVLDKVNASIEFDGAANDLTLRSNNLNFEFNREPVRADAVVRWTPPEIFLQRLALNTLSGVIDIPVVLATEPATHIVRGSLSARDLSVAKLLAMLRVPLSNNIEGHIESFTAEGMTVPRVLPRKVSGVFRARLTSGAIRNFNLLSEILRQASALPFLDESLLERIPPQYTAALKHPDTPIHLLEVGVEAHNGALTFNQLLMKSDLFSLSGSGSGDTSGEARLRLKVVLAEEISRDITIKVPELKGLCDSDDRLVIPVTLSASGQKVFVVPNLEEIVKQTSVGAIQKALERGLKGNKKLGRDLRSLFGL